VNDFIDLEGHKEAGMNESLTVADYVEFEKFLKLSAKPRSDARKLVVRAVQELAAVIKAASGPGRGGGGGIIHVATRTDPGNKPPHICRTALELIFEGLDQYLITEDEVNLEARNIAYKCLAEFWSNLTPVEGTNLFKGTVKGALTKLGQLLASVH
jgi:hypothetical protein